MCQSPVTVSADLPAVAQGVVRGVRGPQSVPQPCSSPRPPWGRSGDYPNPVQVGQSESLDSSGALPFCCILQPSHPFTWDSAVRSPAAPVPKGLPLSLAPCSPPSLSYPFPSRFPRPHRAPTPSFPQLAHCRPPVTPPRGAPEPLPTIRTGARTGPAHPQPAGAPQGLALPSPRPAPGRTHRARGTWGPGSRPLPHHRRRRQRKRGAGPGTRGGGRGLPGNGEAAGRGRPWGGAGPRGWGLNAGGGGARSPGREPERVLGVGAARSPRAPRSVRAGGSRRGAHGCAGPRRPGPGVAALWASFRKPSTPPAAGFPTGRSSETPARRPSAAPAGPGRRRERTWGAVGARESARSPRPEGGRGLGRRSPPRAAPAGLPPPPPRPRNPSRVFGADQLRC